MKEEIFRSRTNRMLAGVCGGLGEHFHIDPTILRILFVILGLFQFGFALVAYIIGIVVLKENPYESEPIHVDSQKTNLFLGAGLILFGILSLVKNYIGWFDWRFITPVALIAVGALILYKNRENR